MSDSVFAPLTNKVIASRPVAKNADVVFILNKDFRESLTLRSLILLCEACGIRPTAPMLAFALQNSIPGLVGLPMDNPDPAFYIDIAKKFFDPTEITFERKVKIYRYVHNFERNNVFFPSHVDVDAKIGKTSWGCAMDFYVRMQMYDLGCGSCNLRTKKERDAVKEVILEWKAVYEKTEPNDPRYPRFINRILNILEHGMVLRYRYLIPGWLQDVGLYYIGDEHL